ncbi:type II toxin-antitoxin system HigB family toxin [Scytonema hofmannii FACHB-248]|uniref:Type II toxin-antitoxin system HigB family toxin n=1 Tax=Scytonema hofmannii FACHB-248 TaxID=1842502 RepID=A0ABR8H0G1_9CYAN|nr:MULTISPECIES: type II toxin-antitoxin system HigB family toxin [Nostocales]MBD2608918.1 type II toxin-antitoxin system HigB family toxin [Scytonema hofmannii FACHB-248]
MILRQVFPSADLVGNFIVFNISANNYRLITYIDYEFQITFVRAVLTHAEYDKENWKIERAKARTFKPQTVDDLRQEFGLGKEE